jgi:hypothetical protein
MSLISRSEGRLAIRRARLEWFSRLVRPSHVQTALRETPAASAILLTGQPSARRCAISSHANSLVLAFLWGFTGVSEGVGGFTALSFLGSAPMNNPLRLDS